MGVQIGKTDLDDTIRFAIDIPMGFQHRNLLIEVQNVIFKGIDAICVVLPLGRCTNNIVAGLNSPEFIRPIRLRFLLVFSVPLAVF